MPFADYANFADCVRQNPQADDPDAYCGSIQARTENKATIRKAVRNALLSVVAKRDPVKEEGDKKLKEADGVAADGAQDDQAFAVAWGPDNYDKLTKRIIALPYREAYQAAGAIVKAIESKAMNFPGDLEDHLRKAHAAIHGREMWDARYGNVCKLLKQARKLLHDIEKTAEVAAQGGEMPQVVGKADPIDKAGPVPPPTLRDLPSPKGVRPNQYMRTPSQMRRPKGGSKKSYALKADPDKPYKRPPTPQVEPGPELGTTPLGIRPSGGSKKSYALKASVRKAVAAAGR